MKKLSGFLLGFVTCAILASTLMMARAQTISCGAPATLSILPTQGIGSAYQNITYFKSLLPSGGTAPYTFSLASGSAALPTGLSLNSGGGITGTPTVSGTTSNIIIQVQDSGGSQKQTATLTTSITVYTLKSTSGISIPSTLTVAVGATSASQTATLTFTDSSTLTCTSCVWMVGPGNPATVNSSTGAVTGIQPGGTASVTTSFSGVTSNAEVVTVTGGTPPSTPTIVSTSPLPPAYSTMVYQGTTLAATGGTSGCCTWAITAGSLTGSGLSLNTSTGAVTGTGSTGGTYSITVTATDGGSNVSPPKTFNVTVNTVSSPVQLSLPGGATSATLSSAGTIQLNTPICTYSNGQGGNSTPPIACPSTLTYSSDTPSVATVNSTGLISAVGAGTARITATVPGCATCTSNQITITVASGIQITTPATLPAPCDLNFQCPKTTLAATGGSGTGYTWTITSGAPTGCGSSVSSAGVYICTPTASGTFSSFIIKVTDSMSNTVSKTFTQVVGAVSSLTISCNPTTVTLNSTSQCQAIASFSDGGSQNVSAGSAPISLIQATSCEVLTGATTCTATWPKTTLAGSNIHASCQQGADTSHQCTIADSALQSYTQVGSNNITSGDEQDQWEKTNSAATTTITMSTAAASTQVSLVAFEIGGSLTSSDLDGAAVQGGSTTLASSDTSAALTTTNANDLLIDCVHTTRTQNIPMTAGTGFTIPTNGSQARQVCQYQIVSSIQTALTAALSWSPQTAGHSSIFYAVKAASSTGAAWSTSAGSISGSGLYTGSASGSNTVSATYGGKSSNVVTITVQGQTDTGLVVAPASGSATVGASCPAACTSFTAKGNVTGGSYTNTAVWASTNTSVATSQGNGSFMCIAGGTATVTASFSTLTSGSGTLTCSAAVSGTSLLQGCSVSTSNTVTGCVGTFPPAGWSLAIADSFEGSGSGCAVNQAANEDLTFNTLNTAQAHTGSCSMDISLPAQPGGNVSEGGFLNIAGYNLGCCTNGDFYMSEWRYFDTNAVNGGQPFESVFGEVYGGGSPPIDSTQNQAETFDLQNYGSVSNATGSYILYAQTNMAGATDCAGGVLTAATPQNCGYGYPGTYNFPLGHWEQDEMYYHASTCTGGVANNDGFAKLYVNGVLVEQIDATHGSSNPGPASGNLNGCVNMATSSVPQLGGYWTFFGATPSFHVHVDDIIVLKR